MGKLDKQTFNKETLIEYKKLRKNNPEIIGVQEFFRDYVGDILKKESKTNFEKSDFEVFEGYFENIKQYQEILKEEGLNISIEKTEMFILGQSIEEFKKIIKNEKIKDLIKYGKIENIKLFFGENGIIKAKLSLDDFLNHYNFEKILYLIKCGKIENIKLFFGENGIIKTKLSLDDFLNHHSFEKILDLIKSGKSGNIKLFFGKDGIIKNIDELEELFEYGYSYLVTGNYKNKLSKLIKLLKKGFTANNLGENFDLLFPVKSSGSKVFDEIKKSMKDKTNKDIYEILREKATNYLDNKNLEKQNSGDLELAIYLRYNHTVNYPEIGELIIIFMQEAIKKGLIKGVKGIKILPREKFTFPRDTILDENSRFCNVSGENFKKELNKHSIPFYLSHSSNQAKGGVAVVSSGMDQEGNQINLGLELEAKFDKAKTNKKTINEVFETLLKVIGELNKSL